jgi:MFS family permease
MPLFLQVVKGASPTASGLQMLPMMAGLLVTSITTGQLISRSGRYKAFPVAGTFVMTAALSLLARLRPDTPAAWVSAMMLLLGIGLGLVMQVLVIAVQNEVDYGDLGVATSGALLFRFIGGSVGTAALGALFASRLHRNQAHLPYAQAFTEALGAVFVVAATVAAAGFVAALMMPSRPLRQTVKAASADEAAEAFPMPASPDSLEVLRRSLTVLADRDVRRRVIERVVQRAGLDLTPPAAFMLVRLQERPGLDEAALARERNADVERLRAGAAELLARGLIAARDGRRQLTGEGSAVFDRLSAARRAQLCEMATEWAPEARSDVALALAQLARELVPETRA